MATNMTSRPVGTRWYSEWGRVGGGGRGRGRPADLPPLNWLPRPQPCLHLPLIPLHQAPAGDALRASLLPRHHAVAQHLQGEPPAACPGPSPPALPSLVPLTWVLPSIGPGSIPALLPFRTAPTTGASPRGWPITSTTLSTHRQVSGLGPCSPFEHPFTQALPSRASLLCFLFSLWSSAG